MSTYRYRSRPGSYVSNVCKSTVTDMVTGQASDFYSNVSYADYGPIITSGYGYPCSEEMSDYTSLPSEGRPFHSVCHKKHTWGVISNLRKFYFQDPDVHPAQLKQLTFVRAETSTSGLPAVGWTDLANNLASKLNGSISCGSLLLVTLAEARKTIRMIKNPFNLLRTDWRKIAKGFTPATLLKQGSNVWLEKKYGWDSMFTDLKSIKKTYGKCMDIVTTPDSSSFEATRLSVAQEDCLGVGSWNYLGNSWSQAGNEQYSNHTTYYANSAFRGRRKYLSRLILLGCWQMVALAERWSRSRQIIDSYGLTLPKMVDTIWELIPFSFVIDWFIDPLGIWNLPGSISRLNRSDVRDLHLTIKSDACSEVQCNTPYGLYYNGYWAYQPISYLGTGVLGRGECHDTYYSRDLISTTDMWSTMLGSLIDRDLSLQQGVSGAALAIQRALR